MIKALAFCLDLDVRFLTRAWGLLVTTIQSLTMNNPACAGAVASWRKWCYPDPNHRPNNDLMPPTSITIGR